MDSQPTTIGRYEVRAFIARGGMGTVYLGWDPVLQRQVAIKLLRESDNPELRTRFTREARAAANLRHRNIVTIFDVGDHQGQPFMAMEYIHGQTLGAIVASEPAPSTVRRLQFIEDLCDGLAYAHKRGVVHRDIKPANLMVDAEGTLKILDFGIARAVAESGMTQAGLLVGSLNYMSPEQVAGTPVDARSDIFAVGAVMYELLTRRPAFPGSIDSGVLNRILNVEPEPVETLLPHLDPAIGTIVRRALHKNAAERYGDLLQMRADIAQVRRSLEDSVMPEDGETIAVIPQQNTTRVTPTPRRGADRDEIARRRMQQIEEHVAAARQLLADGAFDETIARCEQALLLDPNESRALDIAERARLQRDEAGAREWLTRAQQHLKAGDLSSASNCVREALTLVPESGDALEMRRIIGEARLAQERERQRAAAVQAALDRGHAALERGAPEESIAAADEALAAAPSHAAALELKERAQQAVTARERARRDEEARQTAAEARSLFAAGQHAEALALLEQFWPAHPVVSHAWTELSAEAARLECERDAASRADAEPAPEAQERTVFVPRAESLDDRTVLRPVPPKDPVRPVTPAAAEPAATPPTRRTAPPVETAPAPAPPARTQPAGAAARSAAAKPVAASRSSSRTYYVAGIAAVLLLALAAYFVLPGDTPPALDTTTADGSGAGGNDQGDAIVPTTVPATNGGNQQAGDQAADQDRAPTGNERDDSSGRGGSTQPDGGRSGANPKPAPPPTTVRSTTSVPVQVAEKGPPTPAPTTAPPVTTSVPATTTVEPLPKREPEQTIAVGPAPAVTTVKPLPPPPPPGPSDEELVRRTIMAYAQAFAAVNAAGVVQVFPSMQGTIGDLFRNVEWQRIDISNPQVAVNGTRATVRAMVEQTVKPRAGGELRVRESTEFQLEKRGSSWIILRRARAQ